MDFSAVHIHLAINHSPLFAELFALCLILFGLLKKRREFNKFSMPRNATCKPGASAPRVGAG